MSSAILYVAIVAIWAGVLIPRFLRRESSAEERTRDEAPATETADQPVPDRSHQDQSGYQERSGDDGQPGYQEPDDPEQDAQPRLTREEERARVLGARRRLLGMLLLLDIGAGVLALIQMAAWWVVVPPTIMLAGYVALLREASKADKEREERWQTRRAETARASAAAHMAPVLPAPVPTPAPDAQIIDITASTARADEEIYDQYTDAKLRAVGD